MAWLVNLLMGICWEYFEIFLRNSWENLGISSQKFTGIGFEELRIYLPFLLLFSGGFDKEKFFGIGHKEFQSREFPETNSKEFGEFGERFLEIFIKIVTWVFRIEEMSEVKGLKCLKQTIPLCLYISVQF